MMASGVDTAGATKGWGAMQRDPSSHSLIGPRGLGSTINQFLPSMPSNLLWCVLPNRNGLAGGQGQIHKGVLLVPQCA